MSEIHSIEVKLRGWRPRRPSASLKRRLFAEPVRLVPRVAWFVGWLVPATACILLTFAVFSAGNTLPSSGHEPLVATVMSNQGFRVSALGGFQPGQNELLSVTFDLTNRNGPASTIAAFPRHLVN